jgi:hypothetical protein
MAITFNPISGNFDEVEVPITVDTTTPVLSTNGDIHAYYDGSNAYIYWESNGNIYTALGTAG